MKVIESSVKKPVGTVMIFSAVLLLSVFAFSKLKVDFLPDFSFPTLAVVTGYANVGPSEIEETLTRKIEEIVATVQNVKKVKSTSSEGVSVVSVEFNWGTNMMEASADVRDKIDQIRKYLPADSERSIVFKFDMSMIPVLVMNIETDNIGLGRRYAEDYLKTEFEQVAGVAKVTVNGGSEREIHIRVNRNRLNAFNLTFDDISRTVATENINIPGGDIKIDRDAFTIRTLGEYRSIHDIRKVVLAVREYSQIPVGLREIVSAGVNRRIPIYLENVAEIVDSYKEKMLVQSVNNVEGLSIVFQKQSDANTVEVVKAIRKRFQQIRNRIPSNMKIYELFNIGDRITQSISNVSDSALQGGFLALLILFIFLRNFRATLIIGIAMPVSILATFLLMYMNKITLNMMSFGGLALGVGMLVDNAVVVLENIFRHREKGETATFASIIGTKEVAMPIIASTLTTVCVFVPVLFVQGISGILFKEMALTISFSLLASLVVAITIIPMLSSLLLAGKKFNKEKKGFILKLDKTFNSVLTRLDNFYSRVINWVLDNRKKLIIGTIIMFVLSLQLCRFIPTNFMPENENDNFAINIELKEGTRLERTVEFIQHLSERINKNVKGVLYVSAQSGSGDDISAIFRGLAGTHTATLRVVLYPREDVRRISMFKVRDDVRKIMEGIPGIKTTFVRAGMMGSSASPVEIQILGHDIKAAMNLARRIESIVKNVKGTKDVKISRTEGKTELVIRIDRVKASSLGLSVKTISDTVRVGFAGSVAARYREGGDEIDINIRLRETDRLDMEDLKRILIKSPLGFKVPLLQVATISESIGPSSIERLSQQRVVYVQANVDTNLDKIVGEIRDRIQKEIFPLPEGFNIIYGSEYEDQQESFRDLGLAFIIAILLVYMVMAAQFESIKHPFIILFSIPLSIIGVTLLFFFTSSEFNTMGFLGSIILVGIVVNNAIVLIDFVNILRRDHGYSLRDALIEGGRTRLRPILMTTLTTILGLIPMAFFGGVGSEVRAPMAVAIIGGLFTSTLLTLVVMPVIYFMFERSGIKKRNKKRRIEEILEKEGIE